MSKSFDLLTGSALAALPSMTSTSVARILSLSSVQNSCIFILEQIYFYQQSKACAKVATREQNEKKFGQWEKLANGGRRYFREVVGRYGWRAQYVKEVDADEGTLSFRQEIYDDNGNLKEIHEKFPLDKGHRKV